MRLGRCLLCVLFVGSFALACSGTHAAATAASAQDAATNARDSAAPFVPHVPVTHLPSPVTCPVNDDGGPVLFWGGRSDQCTQDSDCGAGQGCMCGVAYRAGSSPGGPNQCVPARCATDADCGEGGFCSPSSPGVCASGGIYGFFCHTPSDTCDDDTDCLGGTCASSGGAWACVVATCAG